MRLTVIRRKARILPEALLILAAGAFVPWLPRRAIVALAGGLGGAAYAFSGRLRRVALANLEAAYGGALAPVARRRIARGAFRTFCLVLLDLFWFSAFTRSRVARYVRFDASADPFFETAPLVAVTAHMGNWEVMGLAAALKGAPPLSVAAEVKSPVGSFFMHRARRRTGLRLAPRKGGLRLLLRELREGGRVALLMDQNTREDEGGEFVDFFGLPATVSKAAASLCARTGAALFVAACVADRRGVYRVEGLPPIPVGGGGALEGEATVAMTRAIETLIRRHPEAWMWMYKRWRYVPPGADARRFPFYAKPAPAARTRGVTRDGRTEDGNHDACGPERFRTEALR